ncbi:MAG: hypothetical protein ACRDMV_20660 [Streptosporangiales bacterium]
MRRVLPAVGLFFLSPLVAEFLLGDIPTTAMSALVLLAPTYGGGALLIREVSRRAGLGWPSMLALAAAYGVAIGFVRHWPRQRSWPPMHGYALAAGALLTYA